jgi:hypothetical protein
LAAAIVAVPMTTWAADPVNPVTASGQAAFLDQCPLREQADNGARFGILGTFVASLAEFALTKAADAAASWATKENQKLNAVVTYSGHSSFYSIGPTNAIAGQAGCIVIARFPKEKRTGGIKADIEKNIGVYPLAGFTVFGDGTNATFPGDPDFYAEFAVVQALPVTVGSGANIKHGFAGYLLKPRYLYFGQTAASRTGSAKQKAVRVELELRRLKLDTGAFADKAYYETAFDFGKIPIGQAVPAADVDKVSSGPPMVLPAPVDLKSPFVTGNDGKPLAGTVVDPVFTRIQAKAIEAEDPSFIMKALAKASEDTKGDLDKAAKTLSERIGEAIETAAKK